MLGINSQLVEIDSNRRLSQIVRNLASNCVMEHDGSNEYGITIPAMVTIVCSSNDIPHVWHRIVANLEMDSHN